MKRIFQLIPLCVLLAFSPRVEAVGFENGDFAKGKFCWGGEADIGFLHKDGTIEPSDPVNDQTDDPYPTDPDAADKVPILEIKTSPTNFRRVFQSFLTRPGTKSLEITIVYKGSPGFKRSEESPEYTSKTDVRPNTATRSTIPIFPAVDMFMRLDHAVARYGDYATYELGAVKAGDDWQTLTARCPGIAEKIPVTLNIFTAPGVGSLYIKSITIAP